MAHDYDPKCEELAKAWLEDMSSTVDPERLEELTRRIQDTIEDYLEECSSLDEPDL